MEAKLKTLRVADLRELLQKASVPIPAKSNKSDLIAKVLASPAALQALDSQGSSVPAAKPKAPESSQGGQDDDLLAPPEEFDWGSASVANGAPVPTTAATTNTANSKASVVAVPVAEKQSTTQPSPSTVPVAGAPSSAAESGSGKVDDEMERRKRRAARFGIPLVEAKSKATPASNGAKTSSRPAKAQTQTSEDTVRLEARAARFGVPKAPAKDSQAGGQKRARSPAAVDKEEMERRKKRAERFSAGGETKVQA